MRKIQAMYVLLGVCFAIFNTSAQQKNATVTGTVIESTSNLPLEYASVYAQNNEDETIVSGGITDDKGFFSFEVPNGSYYMKIDFLGFKTIELSNVAVRGNTSLGVLKILDDTETLDEVTIIAERSTVDIKLDKKVYNVGQDMIVKGGTASDVLDNVPSISVDAEGSVSLRGNENVKVLIDGKPSGLASNISEAMRILPAESIERVEVITNPSARYEAEGGAGIINIVLRKGQALGVNGSVTGTVGHPSNYDINANVNLRGEKFNLFTTSGYSNSTSEGYSINNNEYLDRTTGLPSQYINESKDNERTRKGYNVNFGLEWFLTDSFTWSNTVSARKNKIENPNHVNYDYFDEHHLFDYARQRDEDKNSTRESIEYTTAFEKQFNDEGHVLNIEYTISQNKSKDNSLIENQILNAGNSTWERTFDNEANKRDYLKLDYVLPLGENGQFEAGYLGNFSTTTSAFSLDNKTENQWVNNSKITNTLEYKEKVNALYAQYGSKLNSFSYMLGLRYEDSNINVNQLTTSDFNKKKYNDFFPSVFLNYEFSESSNASLSYSRRINRPRGWFLNPFSNYSSDINFFQGNPDLDPSKTHAFDLGYIKRWTSFTLSSSAYLNKTDDSYQFVKRINGTTADGTPITVSSPINLATEYRYGFEFTANYSPFKWWRLNGNFNFFRVETRGDYTFTDSNGSSETQNFDNDAYSWFARVSSKVTLPYKIDWQLNGMYRAPQNTAQGKMKGNLSANLALSKDILKDNATITLNVSDLFDSRKRIYDMNLPYSNSYSEMQWRGRQINLSFTYRFNQSKNEKPKYAPRGEEGDSPEML